MMVGVCLNSITRGAEDLCKTEASLVYMARHILFLSPSETERKRMKKKKKMAGKLVQE